MLSIKPMKQLSCDFCQSKRLDKVYSVTDSNFGSQIFICNHCGLTQTIYTKTKAGNKLRKVRISSGADWGNIRHGKGLRFKHAQPLVESLFKTKAFKTVLDIGSNRGSFVAWLSQFQPQLEIVAIEPDKTIISNYNKFKNIKLYQSKFENLSFENNYFDFIYSCHTLEHVASAAEMLNQSWSYLKPNGYMFLEIPNLEIINDPNLVEEFFIDKHSFHFNRLVLIKFLETIGFKIISGKNDKDVANITLLLQKKPKPNPTNYKDLKNTSLVAKLKKDLKNYQTTLAKNQLKLKQVGQRLNRFLEKQTVAIWGAGRIFDALVKYGQLNTSKIKYLIDQYLSPLGVITHGLQTQPADCLRIDQPDVVIVLAKSSTKEIIAQIKKYGINRLIKFEDLIQAV